MRSWNVGDEVLERDAVGALTLTGRPEIYSGSSPARGTTVNQTHGCATLVFTRQLEKSLLGLNVTNTSMNTTMNTADMGTRCLSATTRRTLLALMPLCFGERLAHGYVPERRERHRAQRLQCIR